MYSGAQFDWDSLYSVFWSPSTSGVKVPTPSGSPQESGSYNIYCPEAAHVLLAMAHITVNEVSKGSLQCRHIRASSYEPGRLDEFSLLFISEI